MNHRVLLATAVAVGLLCLPSGAFAHVTLQPSSVPANQFVRLDIRVPNEKGEPTTKLDVRFPDGFVFASYEPVPGWKVTVKKKKLDKPVTAEGERFTEQISRITWSGGEIAPGQFQDFGLSLRIPDKPGTHLVFPALQTYEGGEVVRWIGAEGSDAPAARVEVTAAEEERSAGVTGADGTTGDEGATGEAGASPEVSGEESAGTEESGGDGGGDEDSKTLSIIALVVGGLGLVTGGFALSSARRRR